MGINSLDYLNLSAGSEPCIVRVDRHPPEAKPESHVVLLLNQDIPSVIGQVDTLLAANNVNIAEWRLGRDAPGGEALSFINLDREPSTAVLGELSGVSAVTGVKLVAK